MLAEACLADERPTKEQLLALSKEDREKLPKLREALREQLHADDPRREWRPLTPADVNPLTFNGRDYSYDMIAAAEGSEVAERLVCPLTKELLGEPVKLSDGYTYERAAIESWLEKNDTSPMTGQLLSLIHI